MVRFLSPRDGSSPARRAALPPEALLVCTLIAAPAAAGDAGLSPAPPPLTVVARPGDTLSGLAARHLGDEAAWPRVWATNAQLRDPNVLEVGDVVRLPGAAEPEVALAHQLDVPGTGPAAKSAPGALGSSVAAGGASESKAEAAAAAAKTTQPERPTLGHALWSKQRVQASPRVVATLGDSTLVRFGERLAVDAAGGPALVAGERYVTLARSGAVEGAEGGQVVSVTGVVCALGGGARTEVRLEHLVAEVEAGQLLAPLSRFVSSTGAPAAAPAHFRGRVLELEENALTLGGGKLVFLSAGSRAGLAPGMRLWLVDDHEAAHRPHAQASGPVVPMPPLGELRVVAVEDDSATCTLVRSGREIERGQTVVGGLLPTPDAPAPR